MARLLCKYRVADGNVAFGNEREEITPIRQQEILDTRVLFDRSVENNGDGDVITRRSLVALMNVVEQRSIARPWQKS